MKIGQSNTLDDKHYQKRRIEDIARAVNGGLEFGAPLPATAKGTPNTGATGVVNKDPNSNMSGHWVNTVTPGAGQTFTVTHNLGRVPTGMLVFAVDQPGAVIHAVNKASWTKTTAYFQSNVGGVSLQGFVS